MVKNIPNILSMLRLVLIPVIFFYGLQGNYIVAGIVLIISGITDVLDGYIARKYNFVTDFGTLLDPLADKMTQISTLFVLFAQRLIPAWIVLIVIIKEAIMVCGAAFLYDKHTIIPSKWYGKAATALFYIAIIVSMVNKQFNLNIPQDICLSLFYIALALTLFSLVMYFISFYKSKKLNEQKANV